MLVAGNHCNSLFEIVGKIAKMALLDILRMTAGR